MIRRVAGVLLLSVVVNLAPPAVTAQQYAQSVRLSGHASYSRTSPPTSGVKLLEDIFQRVRSAPQIAMQKNLYKQQLDAPQEKAGPTDYRLAIRPKTLAGKSLPSPSLRIVAAEPASGDSLSGFANVGNGAGGAGAGAYAPAGGTFMANNSKDQVAESWLGNRQFPMVAQSSNTRSNSGLWEPQAQMQQIAAGDKEMSPQAHMGRNYRPPDLATAAGRLAGITKVMQEAQSMAAQSESNTIAQNPRRERKMDQISLQGSDADGFAGNEDDSGVMRQQQRRDVGAKKKEAGGYYANKGFANSMQIAMNTPAAAPPPPATVPAAPMKLARAKSSEEGSSLRSSMPSDEKKERGVKIAMADNIALLPPNVVTGIPLVRLGISETQANGALQAIGNMKPQKVNKWTVWSWNRPQSKTGTSLQLYVRNGLLDAMRIFDPSLIGPDFGVNLGDSLSRVKEKFGEPAFILSEPGPGAGQNYVYPISQIGFQLARPNPGEQPRVVSVLIFNVK